MHMYLHNIMYDCRLRTLGQRWFDAPWRVVGLTTLPASTIAVQYLRRVTPSCKWFCKTAVTMSVTARNRFGGIIIHFVCMYIDVVITTSQPTPSEAYPNKHAGTRATLGSQTEHPTVHTSICAYTLGPLFPARSFCAPSCLC